MNIVALAGGVGGAKLAQGLTLTPVLSLEGRGSLTIIVNTGDDFEWHGLTICPDLDTVTYTLGGWANTVTGWGVAGDTFEAIGALQRLGIEPWFKIGDRDLATHVYRTELLRQGQTLTEVTRRITRALGIEATILPMTDDRLRTMIDTDQGVLEFQEYFVRRQWQPIIRRIFFDGAETARATPQVSSALAQADAILIAPSNPFVSVEPILSLTPLPPLPKSSFDSASLRSRRTREAAARWAGGGVRARGPGGRLAVSPIVGGQALKGPAAKMFRELGVEPSAFAVAQHYHGLVTHFVLDQLDADQESAIQSLGMKTLVTNTIMPSVEDRVRLATEVVEFVKRNT